MYLYEQFFYLLNLSAWAVSFVRLAIRFGLQNKDKWKLGYLLPQKPVNIILNVNFDQSNVQPRIVSWESIEKGVHLEIQQ